MYQGKKVERIKAILLGSRNLLAQLLGLMEPARVVCRNSNLEGLGKGECDVSHRLITLTGSETPTVAHPRQRRVITTDLDQRNATALLDEKPQP